MKKALPLFVLLLLLPCRLSAPAQQGNLFSLRPTDPPKKEAKKEDKSAEKADAKADAKAEKKADAKADTKAETKKAETKTVADAPAVKSSAPSLPEEKTSPVRLTRFERPPVIDAKLDDEVWKTAAVFKDFYQFNPGDNIAPSKPTEVRIGYDSKFLYIAFHCYDEPGKVRATVARRDNVFGEDNVRVFLDTFNDQRKAYVLGFNPLGVQQYGIHTENQGIDFSVDIVMESKGAITEDGWIVEVAVPFKSLRYEAGKDKVWGLHVWR
ncbi:MAG TPA: carbohydrate binding family 9 domain-containing protein, partial [Pyrinomonadaceae bacterium]